MDDLMKFLESFDKITSIVFENTMKSANCDPFVHAISRLSRSVQCLTFINSLSAKGAQKLSQSISDCRFLLSLSLQHVPIKNELIPLIQGINSSSLESLVCTSEPPLCYSHDGLYRKYQTPI